MLLDVGWLAKNCERCDGQLDADDTFYVRIGIRVKVVCGNCHSGYIRMIEDLFSSRKITSGSAQESIRMMTASVEWFNAPVTQR